MPKYWGKQIFSLQGEKQKTEKREKRKKRKSKRKTENW